MAKFTPLGKRGEAKSGDHGKNSRDLKLKLTVNSNGSGSTSSGKPVSNPYAGSSTQLGASGMGSHQKDQTTSGGGSMQQAPSGSKGQPVSGDPNKSSGDLGQYKPPADGLDSHNTASGTPTENPYAGSSTQPGDMDRYEKDPNLSDDRPMRQGKPVYDDQADPNLSGDTFDPGKYNKSGTSTAAGTPTANPYSDRNLNTARRYG